MIANANQGELCDFQRELRQGKVSLWIGVEVSQTFLSCQHYLGLHRALWVTCFSAEQLGKQVGPQHGIKPLWCPS